MDVLPLSLSSMEYPKNTPNLLNNNINLTKTTDSIFFVMRHILK